MCCTGHCGAFFLLDFVLQNKTLANFDLGKAAAEAPSNGSRDAGADLAFSARQGNTGKSPSKEKTKSEEIISSACRFSGSLLLSACFLVVGTHSCCRCSQRKNPYCFA